jgi:hypothetical protein
MSLVQKLQARCLQTESIAADVLRILGGVGSGVKGHTTAAPGKADKQLRSGNTNAAIKTVTSAIKRGGNMADDYHEHGPEDFASRFGLQPHEGNAVYNAATLAEGRAEPILAEHAGAKSGEVSGSHEDTLLASQRAHDQSVKAEKENVSGEHFLAQSMHQAAAKNYEAAGDHTQAAVHTAKAAEHGAQAAHLQKTRF